MGRCEQCIIREFSSLKALTREELLTISETKTHFIVKKGETIFTEGDNLNGVFCIKDGFCKLTKLNSNGKDTIVKLAKNGDLLGQRSIINEETSNLTATAIEDMQICFIPKKEMMEYFTDNNKFSLLVTRDICNHLKDADKGLADHTHKTVKERLAIILLKLEEVGGINPENNALNIQLSREDLANMVGTATESCIRLLSELKKDGIIELSGKKIILKDKNELKALAQ
ncbi:MULTISPECIES: Crp/Fnr family transcriptional regulator [Myroides]|uniref:cAMP-binding domain of CRP or a regulatory subunit of cAMP-dependent protein kinases n=1 Tax=Myroides profundi TaxID=480520 RepID=A0AAJ4W2F4_MYRPR|nr:MULTISPECIES: Crp/Fnr family transcriptional regulator [Myroides]AJH13988.1 Crp/Fnr family transcriptional regulator [Myroides profundi]MDM1396147.1 Crp/Fnr family transcriptional regulator [Myroides odoratimimus]MDM1528386.1 Crp/Fnr family transcriptional regulator [Myroides odoratimimus]SEQ47514.1 cAMP-binding domain of CRP or a regulatory subunit of cAMP-dependent protein kinases [Myroides profundi]